MQVSVNTVSAPVVALPTTTTIVLEGLDAGQVRRFRRIFENQAAGTHYDGAQTNAFAAEVVAAL
jgi:hypothetical protein